MKSNIGGTSKNRPVLVELLKKEPPPDCSCHDHDNVLAYCNKIVQLHQGEIWVESEVGKGTLFQFTIAVRSLDQFQDDPNRVN
jgi:hypothetical protein